MEFITDYTKIDREQWRQFVLDHPQGEVFHTPEMMEVYAAAKYHTPLVVAAIDNSRIVALVAAVVIREKDGLLGMVSARSIIWGGPLLAEGQPESVLTDVMRAYNKTAAKSAIYSQVRNTFDGKTYRRPMEKAGYVYEEHLTYVMDLELGEDQLLANMNKKRRNEVRRSYKEGVEVRVLDTQELVAQAYEILTDVYLNVNLPLADQSLFQSAFDILHPKEMIRFFGAFYEDELIGVIVVFTYKELVFNWYAGAKRDFYKKYPNDVLPWEVMKWGVENGRKRFDLGGAGKPNKEYGVRDFKKKYGGEEMEFGRFELIHRPLLFQLAKTGFRLWQKMRSK